MLYRKIYTVAMTLFTQIGRIHGDIYHVSTDPWRSFLCSSGSTCQIYCDTEESGDNNTYDCGDNDVCSFYCDKKRCAENAIIRATNSNNFSLTQDSTGEECLHGATIYTPDKGDAYFTTQSKVGFKQMTVYAGSNAQQIIIDTSSAIIDEKKNDYQDMSVYASTAEYLKIIIADGLAWSSGTVECPIDSNYNDSACIIEADGMLGSLNITQNDGITYITPSPTPSPTPPTLYPSQVPTMAPTQITQSPSNVPTSPTLSPSLSPSIAPTSPTLSPTKAPSHSTTQQIEDNYQTRNVYTSSLVIIAAVVFGVFWLFICVYFYNEQKQFRQAGERDRALTAQSQYEAGEKDVGSVTAAVGDVVTPEGDSVHSSSTVEAEISIKNIPPIAIVKEPGSLAVDCMDITDRGLVQMTMASLLSMPLPASSAEDIQNHKPSDIMRRVHQEIVKRSNSRSDNYDSTELMYGPGNAKAIAIETITAIGDAEEIARVEEAQKVVSWMQDQVKLSEYTELLLCNGFDSTQSITEITMEDLKAIGIQKIGHRRQIVKFAKQLQI